VSFAMWFRLWSRDLAMAGAIRCLTAGYDHVVILDDGVASVFLMKVVPNACIQNL